MQHQKKLNDLHNKVPASYYHRGVQNNIAQRYWHARRKKIIEKMVKNTRGDILDLGCHGGYLTEFVEKKIRADSVTVVDISSKAIEYVKENHPNWVTHCANIEDPLKFIPDNAMHLILCVDVLEHLLHPEKVIAESARVSKKGATMIIAVPKETFLWKSIWYLWTTFGPGRVWDDVHVQDFSMDDLDKVFEEFGYRKESSSLIHFGIYRIVKYKYEGI